MSEHFEAEAALRAAGPLPPGYPLSDPRAAATVARALAETLAGLDLDPKGAAAYRAAAARLASDLAERERRWLALLTPLRAARVVSYDDSLLPFLIWAGVPAAATLSPGGGATASPRRALQALRALREATGPRIILQRDYDPSHLARILRQRSGAALVSVPLGARSARREVFSDGVDRLVQALLGALASQRRGP